MTEWRSIPNYEDYEVSDDGRVRHGNQNAMAKLTDHQVMAIREEYAKGNITQQMLAEKFGINRRTVSKIINRQRWAHI